MANSGSRIVQYTCVQLDILTHPSTLNHTYTHTCPRTHTKTHTKGRVVFLYCCHSPCLPVITKSVQWGYVGLIGHFKTTNLPKMCKKAKKREKKVCGQTKIKHLSVKTHLMMLWSYSESLQVRVKRSSGDLVRIQQPKQVSKNAAALLWPIWSLSSTWPLISAHHFSSFLYLARLQRMPFIHHTPSIWRWRTTHTCTITQLLSGKELSSISSGCKTPLLFVFFCEPFLHVFFILGPLLYMMSIKAGLRGRRDGLSSEDQSVTFQLQG